MAAVQYHPASEREGTASAALSSGDILLSTDSKACVITALAGVDNGQKWRGVCEGVFDVTASGQLVVKVDLNGTRTSVDDHS